MVELADHDGLQIAYETVGEPAGEPVLLIMGHLGQMVGWPTGFCAELQQRGFWVARFDNRDFGLSTRLENDRTPSRLRSLVKPRAVYGLDDMAGDALAVLDGLGWTSAHLVGISMGGMIAQRLAVSHPRRVRSLTSIMSTPSPRIGAIKKKTLLAMVRLGRELGQPKSTDDVVRAAIAFATITGSPGYPVDEQTVAEIATVSLARDPDPFGLAGSSAAARQRAAIRTSGDRRAELRSITAPTVVIHGDSDVMIRPGGGKATAAAIPGARFVSYPGMGHELPRDLWPSIAAEILAVSTPVGTSATPDPT
jgi:pimeloyl-ACP methyl ester carboxylesterase